MEDEIVKIAMSQGLWATLFVSLLFYVLKETSNRESNYQNIIKDLSKKFNLIEDINSDIKEIKSSFLKRENH